MAKKIHLTGTDLVKDIALISGELQGHLEWVGGCSYTQFSNDFGKGVITGIRVSDEISALIFDAVFAVDVEFSYSDDAKECIDLFFCLEGAVLHKIEPEKGFEKINFRQNALVKRLKSSKNTIGFQAHASIKMSLISYSTLVSENSEIGEIQNLRGMASNSLQKMNNVKDYRYLGRICFRTSNYAQKIMPFTFDNASEILFKEAAILNTLASQLDRYDKDLKNKHANAPIKQYELDKILAVASFVQKNLTESLTIENLVSISGLTASKLQSGFKYLYNTSVNGFTTEKRLEKASELLEQTEMNVSEVVYSVGFSSRSYFSKIFKNRYGISPSTAVSRAVRQ